MISGVRLPIHCGVTMNHTTVPANAIHFTASKSIAPPMKNRQGSTIAAKAASETDLDATVRINS